jgi:formate hydrogenlyase subunit 6/NADH:ubiquinone oxidoreductase subunit I
MAKTNVTIDYSKCGNYTGGIDPRGCSVCLGVCPPSIFIRHEHLTAKPKDPHDPEFWQITAVWLDLCTRCGKCVEACPLKAIRVSW